MRFHPEFQPSIGPGDNVRVKFQVRLSDIPNITRDCDISENTFSSTIYTDARLRPISKAQKKKIRHIPNRKSQAAACTCKRWEKTPSLAHIRTTVWTGTRRERVNGIREGSDGEIGAVAIPPQPNLYSYNRHLTGLLCAQALRS